MARAVETALNPEHEEGTSAEMEAAEALFQAADEHARTPRAHAADGTPLKVEGETSSSITSNVQPALPQITATGLAPGATLWAPPRGASLASLFPDWAQVCAMSSVAASFNYSNGTLLSSTSLPDLAAMPPPPACALVSTPVPRVPALGAPSPVAPGTVVDVSTGEPACPTLRIELIPSLSPAAVPAGALAAGRPASSRDAAAADGGSPGATCSPPSAACVCEVASAASSSDDPPGGAATARPSPTEVRLRAGETSVVAVRGARSWMGPVAGALPLFAEGPSPFPSEAPSALLSVPSWVRPVVAGVGYASTVPEARFYVSPTEADVASAASVSASSSAPLLARAVVVVGRGSPERGSPLSALSPGVAGDADQLAAPATTFAFPACSTPRLTFVVGDQPAPPATEEPALLGPLATPTPTPAAVPEATTEPRATPEATRAPAATTLPPPPRPPPAPVTTPSPLPPPPSPSSPQQQPAFCAMKVPLWGQCGGKGGSCGAGKGRRRGGLGAACEDSAWSGACCGAGNECSRVNEWWWKCTPSSAGASSASSSGGGKAPAAQPVPSPPLFKIHKQCGGRAGDGCGGSDEPACADAPWVPGSASGTGGCQAGSICRRDNEWYWQCARDDRCSSGSSSSGDGNAVVVVRDWGQCGGSNGCPVGRGGVNSEEDCEGGGMWPGHECCGGGECVAVSGVYFSQCQPPK